MINSNNFFQLVAEFQQNINWLNQVLKGGENDSVVIDGVVKPSITKDIEDKWAALSALAQGRLTYKTKAEMETAGAPSNNQLAEVWNDPTPDFNGLYGWTGANWLKAPFSSVINAILKDNRTSPVTGYSVWQIQRLMSRSKNRFSPDHVERGYLPVSPPYDGIVREPSGRAWTSDYIYVGDLAVGARLYIDGLSSDAYGRAFTYYDRELKVIDDSYQSIPGTATKYNINGRKTDKTEYVRLTVVTTKGTDNTDMSGITISDTDYLSEYVHFKPLIHELFGSPVYARFAKDDPTEPEHVVNLGFANNNLVPISGIEGKNTPENLFYIPDVVSGHLPVQPPFDGILIPSSSYTTTGFFSIEHLAVDEDPLWFHGFKGSYTRYIYYYDKDFKPVLNPDNPPHAYYKTLKANSDGSPVGYGKFRPVESAVYARVTLQTADPADDTDVNMVMICPSKDADYIKGDKTVIVIMGREIDAHRCTKDPDNDFSVLNLKYANENLMDRSGVHTVISPENLIYIPDVVDGFMPVTPPLDGVLRPGSSYKASGYFSIAHLSLDDDMYFKGFSGGYGRYIYFYDKDFKPLLNPDSPPDAIYRSLPMDLDPNAWVGLNNFRPTEEAVYARMTLVTAKYNDNTDLNNVQVSHKQQAVFVHGRALSSSMAGNPIAAEKAMKEPKFDFDVVNLRALKAWVNSHLVGKNLATLGDSITAGDDRNWPKYATAILGMSLQNHAVSGGHWEDFGSDQSDPRWFRHQVTALLSSGTIPDVIVVAMGTNSLNASWGDFEQTIAKPFDELDTSTIYGGMRHGIERIRKAYPSVPIYLCTPIQRADVAPNEQKFIDMVAGTEKMAAWYGCEVLHCHSEVGILHQIEKDTPIFLPDGLHPNGEGMELQGRYLASKIKSALSFYEG